MTTFHNSTTPIASNTFEASKSTSSSGYAFHLPYWVVVTAIALMAWRSLIEFGLSARCLKPGWQQHLVEVCAEDRTVCKSVTFVESDDWWSSRVQVAVTPQRVEDGKSAEATKGANRDKSYKAYQLVNSALTAEQHQFAEVVVRGAEIETNAAVKANARGGAKSGSNSGGKFERSLS
jgi:hypothetical protein